MLSSTTAWAQIQESNLRHHIAVLANDSLMGRGTGSSGERMAASYIESQLRDINLAPKGDPDRHRGHRDKTFFQSFPYTSGIHGSGKEGIARNVIGLINNGAENTIIVGAHYDHLGLGNDGNSLDANPQDKIHNGADDNASGVAGVIELARYFQNNKIREKNNFIFIFFSGEELGLFGSKYFTQHPTVDSAHINYMINLDMIGRLDPVTRSLAVSGTGTSPVWEAALKSIPSDQLVIKTDSAGMGPSDHAAFYLKNIPALHFFTGSHSDYHKPSDDADKINYAGEVEVLNYIIRLIDRLEGTPRLAFLTTKNKSVGGSRSFKVTMGIMPNYTSGVDGLQVDGVSEGKPAQKAGVKTGDVIIQMGDLMIKDIQGYMDALGKFEKGQTVPVKVKRGNETISLNVTF
jgi:hypothetical protein